MEAIKEVKLIVGGNKAQASSASAKGQDVKSGSAESVYVRKQFRFHVR